MGAYYKNNYHLQHNFLRPNTLGMQPSLVGDILFVVSVCHKLACPLTRSLSLSLFYWANLWLSWYGVTGGVNTYVYFYWEHDSGCWPRSGKWPHVIQSLLYTCIVVYRIAWFQAILSRGFFAIWRGRLGIGLESY